MKEHVSLLLLVCLVSLFVLSCGCTSFGDPDERFRNAWNQSEAELLPHITNITRLSEEQDFEGLADEAETAIATIDTHRATLASIQVSEPYTPEKEHYLEGLKELRSACVQLSNIDEKSMIDQAIDLYIAQQYLDTAVSTMNEVRSMME